MKSSPRRKPFSRSRAPDERGCVWLVSGKGESAVVVNLGPREPVAEKMADWLGQIDFGDMPGDQ